jgi:hydrogenase nickel incorporation protein HypB
MTASERPPRIVELRRGLLKKNDEHASQLRQYFHNHAIFVVNLVSGPGAGKTRWLEETLRRLNALGRNVAAIVGDPETECDAMRLARSGAPVRQIQTRGICHLEAAMIERQIHDWSLPGLEFLFIENVGNLVCTTSYDLGESLRVVMLSVTEGEEKPLKYPGLFHSADIALLTKVDLADACECDLQKAHTNIEQVCPGIPILSTSARSGEGMDEWLHLIQERRENRREGV